MNTALATVMMTVMFLSAGAFKPESADVATANVTVIVKNSNWPLKGQITTDSCQFVRCIGI